MRSDEICKEIIDLCKKYLDSKELDHLDDLLDELVDEAFQEGQNNILESQS